MNHNTPLNTDSQTTETNSTGSDRDHEHIRRRIEAARKHSDTNADPIDRSLDVGIWYQRAATDVGGGKPVYVREMANALGRRGHSVTLYTTDGKVLPQIKELPAEVVKFNVERYVMAYRHNIPTGGNLFSDVIQWSLAMYTAARKRGEFARINERHDVIWTHFWLDDALVSRAVDVPCVFQCHGYNDSGIGIGQDIREHLSESEVYLANTKSMAAKAEADSGIIADGVVRPGVDIDRFHPKSTPSFDLPGEHQAIVFVGRLDTRKGINDLIDAHAALDDETIELFIVGPLGYSKDPDHLDRAEATPSIHLVGEVPLEDLPGYYAGADVVCHPSHWESFCMSNIEAMACGTPLVATTLDAVEQYATNGETGYLVPPKNVPAITDALDRVLSDSDFRERAGHRAREAALDYSWNEQALAFEEVISDYLWPTETAEQQAGNGRALEYDDSDRKEGSFREALRSLPFARRA